jgi:membrane associated rhomboid family serine protease
MARISRQDRRLLPRYKHHYHKYAAEHGVESETELVKKVVSWLLQPKFTVFLIVANAAMFFWSRTWTEAYFESLVFRPEALLSLNFTPMIASWFLHASTAHLTANLIFLFVFGRAVERRFGLIRTALIYFGAAIISDVVSGLVFQQGGIGASGAIAGLIAAAIIVDPFYLNYIVFGLPIPIVVLGWVAIFADMSAIIAQVSGVMVQTNIGHAAHLAGFFGITLLIFLLNRKDEKIRLGFLVNILTVIAGFAVNYFFPDIIARFVKK